MASPFDVVILPAPKIPLSRKASTEKTQEVITEHKNVMKIYEGTKSFWRSRSTL
jgi:hypothetical protein